MRCDSCEALMINGMFCHETGCPNTHARYDADEDTWIKQVKCFKCGCMVDVGEPCCEQDFFDELNEFEDEQEDE